MSSSIASAGANKATEDNKRREALLRLKDVLKRTGLGRSQYYDLVKRGIAPKSIQIVPGSRTRCWIESEIQQFIDDRIAAARGSKAGAA